MVRMEDISAVLARLEAEGFSELDYFDNAAFSHRHTITGAKGDGSFAQITFMDCVDVRRQMDRLVALMRRSHFDTRPTPVGPWSVEGFKAFRAGDKT